MHEHTHTCKQSMGSNNTKADEAVRENVVLILYICILNKHTDLVTCISDLVVDWMTLHTESFNLLF